MKSITFAGANATGKSTRTFYLYSYLKEKFDSVRVNYPVMNRSKGKIDSVPIGTLFSNGWLIYGKLTSTGDNWIGLDDGKLPSHESRFEFMRTINEYANAPWEVKVILTESYFNTRGKKFAPDNFLNEVPNLTSADLLVMRYDTLQEFVDSTNARGGHTKGLDWGKASPGWNNNQAMQEMIDYASEHNTLSKDSMVMRVPLSAPKDWLVQHYFNDTYSIPDKSTLF